MAHSCPACGAGNSSKFAIIADLFYNTTNKEFAYDQCHECRTIFLTDPPPPQEMGQYYPQSYSPHTGEPTRGLSGLSRLAEKVHGKLCSLYPFYRHRSAFFTSISPGDLFVDYGCGAGESLEQARKHGARTVGIDFAEPIVSDLRRRGHVGLLATEDWDKAVIEAGGARRIRLNHSLEHVHDPLALIQRLARIAQPGCRVHISVPNPVGVSAKLFRASWMGLEAPRHLVILSPERIVAAMTSAGFVVNHVCTEPTGKDLARSLGIMGWRAGLLRDQAAIRSFHERAWALLAGLPLTLPAPLFGKGDRLHIFAERRAKA